MNISVFEFENYKDFLLSWIKSQKFKGRGIRQKLATAACCQVAYISHVLVGERHLSLEQGEAIARFIGLTADDLEYFLLLIESARAGTTHLKDYFDRQLHAKKNANRDLKKRVRIKNSISQEDQGVYYSAWYYQAIRMALTIPELQTPVAISETLRIPIERVHEVLHFFITKGLARATANGFETTQTQIHVGSDSPLIGRMHSNWRQHTVHQLEHRRQDNLHYSAAVTLSESDYQKVREVLLKAVTNCHQIIRPSKEEKLCVLAMDFYSFF